MAVVTEVAAIPVEVDIAHLDDGGIAPYESNHDVVESRERMLIRLETDSGAVGWGEFLVTLESPAATKAIVESVVAPELVGRRVGEIRAFLDAFYFPYVRIDAVLGGVEMAMWDALGQELGTPVHQLLGGGTRDSVPVAFCLGILDPDEAATHARRARDRGFETLKTKAGADWAGDVDRLAAMYDAVDGELAFRLDPNQGWSAHETVRAASTLEEAGVYLEYLEQPMRVGTVEEYRQLRSRIRTPVAINEDTYYRNNLRQLLAATAVDVAVVDLIPAGGILKVREQAAMAARHGVSVSHHSGFDLGIKTAAVLGTIAATPAFDLPPDSVYYAWDEYLLEDPIPLEDGELRVPREPGLGISVDEDAVERLRID